MTLNILIVLSLASLGTCGLYNATLLLTWMGGHCDNLGPTCDRQKYDQWDQYQSFTIHGLRVSRRAKLDYGDFNFNAIRKNPFLLDKMHAFWPPQPKKGGRPHFLWEYQWENYGHNFAELYYIEQGKANIAELQQTFFMVVMDMYESLKVRKIKKSQFYKYQLANSLGISENSFYFICNKNNILIDVKICYEIELGWSKHSIKPRACTTNEQERQSSCYNTGYSSIIQLYDWSNQPNYKIAPMSDQYYQELKDKEQLVYYPAVEMEEDQQIEIIEIDTKREQKKEQIKQIVVETQGKEAGDKPHADKQELSDAERAKLAQDQHNFVDEQQSGSIVLNEDELIAMLLNSIFAWAIGTSLFWMAVLACISKCRQLIRGKDQVLEEELEKNAIGLKNNEDLRQNQAMGVVE